MEGTKRAMAKLLTQLLEAPMEAPRALMERGKISETSVCTKDQVVRLVLKKKGNKSISRIWTDLV